MSFLKKCSIEEIYFKTLDSFAFFIESWFAGIEVSKILKFYNLPAQSFFHDKSPEF